MLAVIKTGGKQYIVKPNEKITVEKLEGDVDDNVVFNEVLLVSNEKDDVKIGTPKVEGATVEGKIVEQGREKKKIVFKYKSKTRQRKKKGHRQHYTKVLITKINA